MPSTGGNKQRPLTGVQSAHLLKKCFQARVIYFISFEPTTLNRSAGFAFNNSVFSDWLFVSRHFLKLSVSESETKTNPAIKGENQRPGDNFSRWTVRLGCAKRQKDRIIIMADFSTIYKLSLVALMCLVQGNTYAQKKENKACVFCVHRDTRYCVEGCFCTPQICIS